MVGARNAYVSIFALAHRLLNLGIEVAPTRCTNIVILDCDILFLNDMWITHTLEALRTSFIVQPFSTSYRMTATDLVADLPSGSAAERLFSQAYAVGMGEGQVGVRVVQMLCLPWPSPPPATTTTTTTTTR